MSFESFLEKITTPASPESMLVVKADFNGLQGAVIDKKGDKLVIGHEASSVLFDLNDALAEVVAKVKQSGWKGQHAIMVSPAVCMTILDLNIPVKNKLEPRQIAETIQWELEPVYNQHKTILVVGQLLQLAGYLNAEQVAEVLQRQNELINSKASAVVYKRFGEIAIEAGFLKKKQVDDALGRQQWFMSEGDALKCGWHPLGTQLASDANEYKWITSGVSQDVLRAWQAAFSQHELKLEAMYPIAGGGVGKITDPTDKVEPVIKDSDEILLELHHGMMTASVLESEVPIQMQSMPCSDDVVLANVAELIAALGKKEDVSVSLIDGMSGTPQQAEQLEADIQTILDRTVDRVITPAGKINLSMRNAVRKFFRVKEASYVEGVSAYEPLPPVMQRFSVRTVLAGLLIIGLIALSEMGLLASNLWNEQKIAAISEDVGRIRGEVKRISKKVSTVKKLQASIQKKQTEKNNVTTMISLLTKELPERNQTLSQLMARLQETVTDDVVINSITEDTLLGFNFNAWALSDQAAQSFVKSLQLAIHPLKYRVKNLTVNENTGRLGLIGYSVNFSITQSSEAELAERRKQPRARY